MPQRSSNYEFWQRLSLKSRLRLTTGVFCIFATIGLLEDFLIPGAPPWYSIAINSIVAGLIALSWAYTFMWNRRFVIAIVITSFTTATIHTFPLFEDRAITDISELTKRGAIEAVACLILIVVGYAYFVSFIGTEGAEQLRMGTEINLAREIHDGLVPPVDRSYGHIEISGRSSASSEVGGDLLDVFEEDGSVVVVVADVSGHGVAAGALMGMVKTAARVKLMDGVKLDELVSGINRVLFQVKGEGMFVTMSVLRFHRNGTVEAAAAGHLPLLRIDGRTGESEVLPNEHVPLGILEDAPFWSRTIHGEPGDVFVLLTDGLTEVENTRGEELGWEQIRDIIAARRTRPLNEIHAAVMDAVRAHGRQEDDQTLALIRVV